MQEERDVLVKRVFPQLRKLCDARAVTLTEVDLRWGITDEETAEGKVLPLCLDEIHRCRPYFVGLLGERYGWIPDSVSPELLESQAWLTEHLQRSVTELEIQHGVFSNEQMDGHAYFYFRDPHWIDSVPPAERRHYTEENLDRLVKLRTLKQRIREAADRQYCRLRENYRNPVQLGQWILDDFTGLVNRLYPEHAIPDALDQERASHEAYARSRRLAFIGRDELLDRLNYRAAAGGSPLVLTGESGCGKSALLAEWAARWRDAHPDDVVLQHYVGSTPDSTDWQRIVRRVLGELRRAFHIVDDIPVRAESLRRALIDWITKVAGLRRVVLVLDALNQLADEGDGARQLGWLPAAFPPNFVVFVSSLPGESLEVMRARGWAELDVPLFGRKDIAVAATAYFKVFSKTPPKLVVEALESTPAACSALYLRTVLDELRQFGKHDELQATAMEYVTAPDLPALFTRILERWERDFGADLVRDSFALLWAARRGLSEGELLELLGEQSTRTPIPRAQWTPLFLAAEMNFAVHSGLLAFSHTYLRAAVEQKYLPTREAKRAAHERVANYFEFAPLPVHVGEDGSIELREEAGATSRALDEEPWQLQAAGRWQFLVEHLSCLPVFKAACATGRRFEWMQYWQHVLVAAKEGVAPPVDLPGLHLAGFRQLSSKEQGQIGGTLGQFLMDLDYFDAARECFEAEAAAGADSQDRVLHASNLNDRGLTERDSGHAVEALRLFDEAAEVLEYRGTSNSQAKALTWERRLLASVLMNKASVLRGGADRSPCGSLLERALALMQETAGERSEEVATVLQSMGNLAMAEEDFTRALSLQIRAHAIRCDRLGPEHRDVGLSLANAANALLRLGRVHHAISLWIRSLAILTSTVGSDHHFAKTVAASLEQAERAAAKAAGTRSGFGVMLLVGNCLPPSENPPDPSTAQNASAIARVVVDSLVSVWDDACVRGSSLSVLLVSLPRYDDVVALALKNPIAGRYSSGRLNWLKIPDLFGKQITPEALVPVVLLKRNLVDWLQMESIEILMTKPISGVGAAIERKLYQFVQLNSAFGGKEADGPQLVLEVVPFDGLDGPVTGLVTCDTGPRLCLMPSSTWRQTGYSPQMEDKRATGGVYVNLRRITRRLTADPTTGLMPLDEWSTSQLVSMATASHGEQFNVLETALAELVMLLNTRSIVCPPERGVRGFRRRDLSPDVEAMLA